MGKAGSIRKHATRSLAPVSFGDTGVSGGTGIPCSRGENRFTSNYGKLDAEMSEKLPKNQKSQGKETTVGDIPGQNSEESYHTTVISYAWLLLLTYR